MKKLLAFIPIVCAFAFGLAQEPEGSVYLYGSLTDRYTQQPLAGKIVYFIQDDSVRCTVLTDEEGFFYIDSLLVGNYTIQLVEGNKLLYKNDVALTENVNLSLLVDTIKQVCLMPVSITASRARYTAENHKLGTLLITSPDDRRLWNMSGKVPLSGPASEDLSRKADY